MLPKANDKDQQPEKAKYIYMNVCYTFAWYAHTKWEIESYSRARIYMHIYRCMNGSEITRSSVCV